MPGILFYNTVLVKNIPQNYKNDFIVVPKLSGKGTTCGKCGVIDAGIKELSTSHKTIFTSFWINQILITKPHLNR